jgi:ligand-binding sensor domain-containing protein/signal transduction histidine kinase
LPRRSPLFTTVARYAGKAASCLAIALTLFIPPPTDAQAQDPVFEHFTVEQGLSDYGVWSILQDRRGFMWFGTAHGLNKYDGYRFTVYEWDPLDSGSLAGVNVGFLNEDKAGTLWLRGPGKHLTRCDRATEKYTQCPEVGSVSDLCEDTAGTLWLATNGRGLNRFERTSRAFRQYRLSTDSLSCICTDPVEGGRILWIGGAGGVDRFDPTDRTFTHVQQSSGYHVTAIHKDRAGVLWIGTNEGVYTFEEATGTWRRCPVARWRSSDALFDCVHSFYEDRRGILWIGAGDDSFSFERATGKFVRYPADMFPTPLPIMFTNQIYEDRQGTLWLRKLGKGLSRIDPADNTTVSYVHDPNDPSSLSDNAVNEVYEDRSGTLWITTVWGGVDKFDRARKAFRHYAHNPAYPCSLADNVVYGICEDRSGQLWVGTRGGLDRFDRNSGRFTHFQHDPGDPHSLSSNIVRAVLEDREGTTWVGTEGCGLDRLDFARGGGERPANVRFRHYTHDPSDPRSIGSDKILTLYEDRSGTLWIGTNDAGLDQFKKDSGIFIHHRSDPRDSNSLSLNWVNAICEDRKGRLWVAHASDRRGGLGRLDRATGEFTNFIYDPENAASMDPGSGHSIYEDRSGTIWIGTTFGLNKFDPSTEMFAHFPAPRDNVGDFITGILEDSSGCLWLKTNRGVSKFNPRTGTFRNYDKDEGVPIRPTWGNACYKSRNGEMFFGGTNGFVRFHPDSIKDNPYIPPVVITGFKKFDKPVVLDTVISEKKLLKLSYRDNVIAFEFVALNYTNPEKNQYAYKLEGFDRDWTYCGTRRYASYTNLDGGSYVFRVKGSNNDGLWNEEGTSIALIITPPFWKTWWFTALFFLATAALVGTMIWYVEITRLRRRLRASEQEHALERERLRISRDMHDEVGADLTEIAILSERAKQEIQNPAHAEAHVQKIAERTRGLIDNISEIIWAINPNNDRLDHLAGYIREFASEYFAMTPISCRFDFPDRIPGFPLSAEVRRNSFLILKEAINNVVKHSGATSVEMCCTVTAHGVEFTIRDDGRGFTSEHSTSYRNGLRNMRKRSEEINGNLQIESEVGRGTQIRLSVPLS